MKLINVTPHTIHLYRREAMPDGIEQDVLLASIEPSGNVPRVAQTPRPVIGYDDAPVPVVHMLFGEPDPLPPPQDGVGYVVSALYAQSLEPPRADVFVPADPVRAADGRVIGCRSLGVLVSLPGTGGTRHRASAQRLDDGRRRLDELTAEAPRRRIYSFELSDFERGRFVATRFPANAAVSGDWVCMARDDAHALQMARQAAHEEWSSPETREHDDFTVDFVDHRTGQP